MWPHVRHHHHSPRVEDCSSRVITPLEQCLHATGCEMEGIVISPWLARTGDSHTVMERRGRR